MSIDGVELTPLGLSEEQRLLKTLERYTDKVLRDDGSIFRKLQEEGVGSISELRSLAKEDLIDIGIKALPRRWILKSWQMAEASIQPDSLFLSALTAETVDKYTPDKENSIEGGSIAPSHAGTSISSNHSLLYEFRKGNKRSKDDYKELKYDSLFDTWFRGFKITAKSHSLDNVLDPLYIAAGAEEEELFQEQNKFLYSVLSDKCKTSKSIQIVQANEDLMDAQAVVKALLEAYRDGMSGEN